MGQVDRLALFATVQLCIRPKPGFDLGAIVKPTLQMAGTDFAFIVLLVAGPLLEQTRLDQGFQIISIT